MLRTSGRFSWPELLRPFNCLQSLVIIALLAPVLTGCITKRSHYDVPTLDLPNQYNQSKNPGEATQSGTEVTPPSLAPVLASPFSTALSEWWRLLGNEELSGLMDRALANNPDLRIATLRIAQSKARMDQASGNRFPTVTMPISMSTTYPQLGVGRGNPNGNNTTFPLSQLSLKSDWRPDIWGESASMYESAELQLLRATFQRDDIQRTTLANVALAYIEYLSLNDRLKLARSTEKTLSEMLAATEGRLKIGDSTITELEQQKAAVYTVRATIPVLAQQRDIVLSRIAGLIGAMPDTLQLSRNGLDTLYFPAVMPGVPSALLLRRPDVRAVETRLLSADADIDVARSRVLPPLDLSAQIGYGSMYMSQVFMPQSLFWTTMASLSVTIFDSGKRAKEVEFAQAVHEEMLETYVRVIYDAIREVDDALTTISFTGKRLNDQSMAADASLRAWNYTQEVFISGAVDYLAVLDAQRSYQRNMDDWYSIRLDRYRGLVNLFSALGGGVVSADTVPGEGLRPVLLADQLDYGAVLNMQKNTATTQHSDTSVQETQKSKYEKQASHALPFPARLSSKELLQRIDWSGDTLQQDKSPWLAEISGIYDSAAILPAWRDLNARYPLPLKQRILLPQRQGEVSIENKERASWYRLYLANFTDEKSAADFCQTLAIGQQNCKPVKSDDIDDKGDFVAPPAVVDANQPLANTETPPAPVQPEMPAPAGTPAAASTLETLPSQPQGASNTSISSTGINWSEQEFWLVEMNDTYTHSNIATGWRSFQTRFAADLKGKNIMPRRQSNPGQPGGADIYQLFIAPFSSKADATAFCGKLGDKQQHCSVASSHALAREDKSPAGTASSVEAHHE